MNRQPLELESYSNPLRIQQVFQLRPKKKFFTLDLWFSGGDITSVGVFAFFWQPLPYPGCQSIEPFFWLKFFWKLT